MSTVKWTIAVLALVALAGVGCKKQTVGPKVADYERERAAAIEKFKKDQGASQAVRVAKQDEAPAEGTDQSFVARGRSYVYDPIGKRDPFRSFILDRLKEIETAAKGPLEQFDLSQLSVTGIVWDAARQRALIMDPSGRGYIIGEGDAIGKNDGRVISISDNVVIVREAYVDFHGDRTTKEIEMRVRQSQGG
jgi:type IV pilus assembly protein PilP